MVTQRSESPNRVDLPVDIRLLGHLEVSDSSGSPVDVPGDRQRALLALLALAYPRPMTSSRLIEELWGGSDNIGEANLQVVVSRLRKSIGAKTVATVSSGYQLDVPTGSIDVDRFRQNTKRGRQLLTLGHPGQAAEAFRQALAQWRGKALSDLQDFRFATSTELSLETERIDVVEWLMEAELEAGDHHLVVGELAGLAESHPTRERLWFLLMLALYRGGRQAEALRAYDRVRRLLGGELGLEPSPELADLEERILLHDPSLTSDILDHEDQQGWDEEPHLASFTPGDVIVEEGTPASTVYWIEDGVVEVYHPRPDGDLVLAQLERGQYFGELASLLGTKRTASVRAIAPTTLSVHTVTSFRKRLGVERVASGTSVDLAGDVEDLMRRGDYLRAYDAAWASIEHGVSDPKLRYLAVLSLARAGATAMARRRFTALGLDTIDRETISTRLAEDISALRPRLDKDMALRSVGEERTTWARRSAEGYRTAYEESPSPYLGTNAATMWLLAGEPDTARAIAGEVIDQLGVAETYWDLVTAAECALVLGDLDRARGALVEAGSASDSDPAARATTLHQLKMICELNELDSGVLEPISNAPVIHYTGHRISAEGAAGRFVADEEERVAGELERIFTELRAGVGYGSLAAGTDILAAERLLALGAELHVVLPFDRDEFVRASVGPAGERWVERFERCLASATSVTTASDAEYLDDPTLFDFCAQIAMGDALVRADALQSEAIQVAVWDGATHGGTAGTEVDVSRWKATGNRGIVIDVGEGEPPATPSKSDSRRQVRGLVFADFAGFSTLSDAQIITFQEKVMGALAKVVSGFEAEILSGRTWGDGVYLVFGDICAAASCSLALQAAVNEIDFSVMGLQGLRGMRVAAHAAPVFEGWDPIDGNRLFYGSGVTKTARIEPRTPEGEVYVTHAFATLAVLGAEDDFECSYVGTLQAAKGYGPVSLYSLRSRRAA
jgi:adenylate cyclase